jgi:hypothetical protein
MAFGTHGDGRTRLADYLTLFSRTNALPHYCVSAIRAPGYRPAYRPAWLPAWLLGYLPACLPTIRTRTRIRIDDPPSAPAPASAPIKIGFKFDVGRAIVWTGRARDGGGMRPLYIRSFF